MQRPQVHYADGQEFRLIKVYLDYPVGTTIKIDDDDESTCPYFIFPDGERHFVHFDFLELIEDEKKEVAQESESLGYILSYESDGTKVQRFSDYSDLVEEIKRVVKRGEVEVSSIELLEIKSVRKVKVEHEVKVTLE
ncbi:hypothetical protein [Rhodopseudomonas palustris]|uniref:hypothetical protein n=1 Tax=Rhodopseudomonas palustris TaxID=1076 RepID=UPI000D1B03A5|nr:hypothetical protein [Rhodopseudomonas palustris]AVT83646.1 hypothetical protein RPYSC3_47860 [Rhodopseudomonas palustris]